ncbi:MAG: UPF0236 family protein [Clostridia bacterium]|nr:UPF0236 family protein [Clostridia bacterium]
MLLFMEMISKEKVNFNSLEENTYKKVMKLGREMIQDELRMIDKLIKEYRDKAVFKVKDVQTTTIKTKLGEIPIARRRYKIVINGITKYVYLLDELLEINEFGEYSQSVVEMIAREITKKSYRETAKTISEDTDSYISYTAVRNIVLALGKKIKKLEEEKIKLYEQGKIEGSKEAQYVFCEHDGIYVKKQKSKKQKGKKKFKVKQFKKKKNKKRKRNGIELKIAVIHEGKEPRYTNDYKLKNKIIIGTASKASQLKKIEVEGAKELFQLDMAHIQKKIYMAVSDEEYLKKMQEIVYTENTQDIFSLIFNYKVELETDNKIAELEKVTELEEYLRNNQDGLLRYQYRLGYKEEQLEEYKETLPSLGSEESQMYCVCRDRMKKNRTSWSQEGAEAMLKVIMNKMNGTLTEVITNKAKEKILEELSQRIAEPVKVRKIKYNELIYAGKYKIADNFVGRTKRFIIDLLNGKKCSELMLINLT